MNKQEDPLLLELHYLPLISTFSLIKQESAVFIRAGENYQKQTFRNRTPILTANGILTLTIPVKHDAKKITEVNIDYDQPWVKNHLKALISSYKHSPYFEYYFPYFEEIYSKRIPSLFTLNLELFFLCKKILKLRFDLSLEPVYDAKRPVFLHSEQLNYKAQQFSERGSIPYRQVFGNTFIPDLSIVDLIFNMGPDSINHI